jgi:uncharacterized protein with PhoU and TrkA domain
MPTEAYALCQIVPHVTEKGYMCRSTIGQLSMRESVRLSVLVLRRGDSDQL